MRRNWFHARALAVLWFAAMVIVPMSPARAAAVQRIPIFCTGYFVDFDDSGARIWEGGPTFHGRNGVETSRLEGDEYCEGTEIDVTNGNGALVGTNWGTFRIELTAHENSGFEGTSTLQFNLHTQSGDEVGRGYGFYEGWQFRASFEFVDEPEDVYYYLTGYVFNPGG